MQRDQSVRVTVIILGLGLLLAALPGRAGGSGELAEEYLRAPQGPYRGLVLNAETGQPLAGALVLAIWQQGDVQIDGLRHFVAARETLTDASGQFVIAGTEVERAPPFLAFPPRFLIFAHGFHPYPPARVFPSGAPSQPFRGPGRTLRLEPARTEEERILAFNTLVALLTAFRIHDLDQPPPGTPPLVHLHGVIRREFTHFGFVEREGQLWHPELDAPRRQP